MLDELIFRIAELERLLANIVTIGMVTQVDEANAQVKVKIGDIETAWLKWGEQKAGADRSWNCPDEGEQVVVLSPSGDLAQGIVSGRLYQFVSPAPANSKDITRTKFGDGMVIDHDRSKKLTRISSFDSEGTIVVEGKNMILRTGVGGYLQTDINGRCERITHVSGNTFKKETWLDGSIVNSEPDYTFTEGEVSTPEEA